MKVELISCSPKGEKNIEFGGRISHKSTDKMKKGSEKEFIKKLIKWGHLSVIEHSYATFYISGVSRVLTHQLVRHRIASYTQKSQRYVNENNFSYTIPDSIKQNDKYYNKYLKLMDTIRDFYKEMSNNEIPNEDARFILPNATHSEIVMTANLREWRHVLELRGSLKALWEIRKMVIDIYCILKSRFPSVFFDFNLKTKNGKQYIEKTT
jgi:thymidylate synthase (FAD)